MKTNRPCFYTLAGRTPAPTDDLFEAMKDRPHIGLTSVGEVVVSTVFLGIDHQFGNGRPLLFETMIFGGEHDQYQDRYSTWDEAEAGHARAVALVNGVA